MAGKKFYWIKLKESFMTSDTVDYLMSQPDGANYVVLYQMLCLKTINTEGKLSRRIGEIMIPFDVEKIVRDCKWFSADTVRIALNLYKAFGLIYEDANGVLVLSDHKNLIGSETDAAARMRALRSGQDVPQLPESEQCSHNVTHMFEQCAKNVTTENRDKENRYKDIIEKEKDKRERETSAEPKEEQSKECPYIKIQKLYNDICVSYPKILEIEGNRRKAVGARWRAHPSLETFEELFKIAEASAFLKGENERNWSADFDWMMRTSNFSKILEHRYDDRKKKDDKEDDRLDFEMEDFFERPRPEVEK